jgi:hypothetical protein
VVQHVVGVTGHRLLDQLIEISTHQAQGCGDQTTNGAKVALNPAQSEALLVVDYNRNSIAWLDPQLAPHCDW